MHLRKRVLITGGAGFLGSHLCERLLQEGNDVLCVDNFYTGSKRNILCLLNNPYFELFRHDITFPLFVEVDEIYNMACPASPVHYQNDPVQTTKVNVHGSINMLGLAKRVRAKILQASTSEVYGDPTVHPQPESYRGNVNPIGVRSCYDEGKRCAETLFFDYHRQHRLRIKVARIFNSLTGDQKVLYYRRGTLYHETFATCYEQIGQDFKGVEVPCFDEAGHIMLRPISAIWKHRVRKPGLKLRTTWGRSVTITEDHSVFTRDAQGRPRAVFGRDLKVGDRIATPRRLPFIDKPLEPFLISDKLQTKGLSVSMEDLTTYLNRHEPAIRNALSDRGVSSRQHFAHLKRYACSNRLPLEITETVGVPLGQEEILLAPHSVKAVRNRIDRIDQLLWFLGFYLAEGCLVYREGGDYQLLFSSNWKYLEKLISCVNEVFGVPAHIHHPDPARAPSVAVRSKIITQLVVDALGFGRALSTEKTIPDWILQLPREQLVHFLHGFWEGDGNHDSKTTGRKLIFNSSSREIIDQLCLLLSKFGILGSVSEFFTRVGKGREKTFKAYRITVQGLDCYDILRLHEATQTLQATIDNDIAWARVTGLEPIDLDEDVYDFSVPHYENFVGGSMGGICCHNTFGPRMHPNDGRVVSNFILQALRGEPITVYGDGSQTRSFCYVDDLVEGLIRLMNSPDDFTGPVNLGNPGEFTILELAEKVIALTNSPSEIIFKSLPIDDPRQRKPDICLANKVLDWQPRIPLEEGLIKTIIYFDTLLKEKTTLPVSGLDG